MNPDVKLAIDDLSVSSFPIKPRETIEEWIDRYVIGTRRYHLTVDHGAWLAEAGMGLIEDSLG